MKRLPHVAILLVAVALVAADKCEKKNDAEKIQGKWTVIEEYRLGKKSDGDVDPMFTFTFSGKHFAINGREGKIEGVFELRPDKKLREMDMIATRATDAMGKIKKVEITWKAIYELSGDTLKICAVVATDRSPKEERVKRKGDAKIQEERPDAFETAADYKRQLLVLKRVKGDDKK